MWYYPPLKKYIFNRNTPYLECVGHLDGTIQCYELDPLDKKHFSSFTADNILLRRRKCQKYKEISPDFAKHDDIRCKRPERLLREKAQRWECAGSTEKIPLRRFSRIVCKSGDKELIGNRLYVINERLGADIKVQK
jgi:hypothetical protein